VTTPPKPGGRVPSDLVPNRLTQALETLRAEGRPIIDLTASNPTRVGLDYPSDLLRMLADPRALAYAPEPLGLMDARRAVAADYGRRGVEVAPERIALTASTSEAYSLIFKVLCEPGDEILAPRPSYPLFDHLARLDGCVANFYDLEYHGRWSVDVAGLAKAMTSRTRAVLLVHPNNPTGSLISGDEMTHIGALCAERDVAIVGDEVFADYEITPGATSAAGRVLAGSGGHRGPGSPVSPVSNDALAFSLGGLSKSVGLPQVKLGWIAMAGPDSLVDSAAARLEFACDTYLSVSTPVQCAAAELLERGGEVRRQIQARVLSNYQRLAQRVEQAPACRLLHADAGWSAVVHVPTFEPEEDLVLDVLMRDGVLVHPGFFFDFPRESFLVLSLLPPQDLFGEGIDRLVRRFEGAAAGGVDAVDNLDDRQRR
jgi:alanine-synthesizing transaminase